MRSLGTTKTNPITYAGEYKLYSFGLSVLDLGHSAAAYKTRSCNGYRHPPPAGIFATLIAVYEYASATEKYMLAL